MNKFQIFGNKTEHSFKETVSQRRNKNKVFGKQNGERKKKENIWNQIKIQHIIFSAIQLKQYFEAILALNCLYW